MNKLIFFFTCLLISSCATPMGSPRPKAEVKKYSEIDAKNLIGKHCKVSSMQKIPRLRLVDLYVCGNELSVQVNRDHKEEQVKILVSENEESQKIIIKDKAQKQELKKVIAQTYALSDEARFNPIEEEAGEKIYIKKDKASKTKLKAPKFVKKKI